MIADEVGITTNWGEEIRCKDTDTPDIRERKNTAFEILKSLEEKGLTAWEACRVIDLVRAMCKESLKYTTIKHTIEPPPSMKENFENPPAH